VGERIEGLLKAEFKDRKSKFYAEESVGSQEVALAANGFADTDQSRTCRAAGEQARRMSSIGM